MFPFLSSSSRRAASFALSAVIAWVPSFAMAQDPVNPAGPVTLKDALSLALTQSPELSSFAWEKRARAARALQAGRFTNPVASVLAEDLGLDAAAAGAPGSIQKQTTLQLSQQLELGGKRSARRGMAEAQSAVAIIDFEAARANLVNQVTESFVDVVLAQEAAVLAAETLDVAERLHQAVAARVAAGHVSPIEETKSGVLLASARIDGSKVRHTLQTRRAQLAALWGSVEPRFERAVHDFTSVPAVPSIETLRASAARNPDLARSAAEVAEREASVGFERTKRWPDLNLTAGYRRFSDFDDTAFLVGVSIPLPIFDRNRDGIEESRSRVSKARDLEREMKTRLDAALVAAHGALAAARDEVAAIEETVLPGARSAFAAVEEGYRAGKFGLLDLLDAQRSLVNVRGQQLRAVGDLQKALARLERLIGQSLSEPVHPSSQIQ